MSRSARTLPSTLRIHALARHLTHHNLAIPLASPLAIPAAAIPSSAHAYSTNAGAGAGVAPTSYAALTYKQFGNPTDVLRLVQVPLPPLTSSTVHVRFLASPINPADINQIQGAYPIKPTFNDTFGAIGGNEGVAEVIAAGSDIKGLKVGDWVIPEDSGFGTWRTHARFTEAELIKLPKEGVSKIAAATISVNPCTAYRMLKDFVDLKPGDVVIQNGANSGVGQAVIQLAKAWGFKTVNVVRDRPNIDDLRAHLTSLGADLVITEQDLRTPETAAKIKALAATSNDDGDYKKGGGSVKLAFNCVGGQSATNLVRLLGHDAHLVTYGAMSRTPLTFPTSPFIFKNLSCHGFWMARWNARHDNSLRERMLVDLCGMIAKGQLREVRWGKVGFAKGVGKEEESRLLAAVGKAGEGFAGEKKVFVM
ncbi:uncharacterized protein EV422DRAFT_534946 [Fimicolochytrium jonesii]|uniref:uncharacterized protein n=1 Tax=Fimicolochytrium jonesii TaxID=1396493 RepID=UPI0022FE2976|nr:uncharacterized protein EV422DRAFT_534946 [Fimicolochytrium jonesii]KAI8819495.1 hypothetical protein EV422DRAFT_534946 [Fimicolochytrium jonesii]